MIPTICTARGRIFAVPAVHGRAVFAAWVHRICRDPDLRPQAVAVELGQAAVEAIVHWMKELGVGRGACAELPCMLGLTGRNRLIHPRHRKTVLRLQEQHGLPLHEIAPGILRRQIGFAGVKLICLSPTDSIIEAIRSAVELDLPVFGIDLESYALIDRADGMVGDPFMAAEDLAAYADRFSSAASSGGDVWANRRRETAMASHLKYLASSYDRILFTCGLAHLSRLLNLMAADAVRSSRPLAASETGYERVIVDPRSALAQSDVLPLMISRYESLRHAGITALGIRSLFAHIDSTIAEEAQAAAEESEREHVPAFLQYLGVLTLVNQRIVPDFPRIVEAAQNTVSRGFAERLGHRLIRRGVEWARPTDWPDLPFIETLPLSPEESETISFGEKVALSRRAGETPQFVSAPERPTEHFFSVRIPPVVIPLDGGSEESDASEGSSSKQNHISWVWPPCEHLLFGSVYRAAEIVAVQTDRFRTEPFEGGLHAGVDARKTIRSFARGEGRIQVRRPTRLANVNQREFLEEPTVVIFGRDLDCPPMHWRILMAGTDLGNHVRDRRRYQEVVSNQGDCFVASVSLGHEREPNEAIREWIREERRVAGTILFGNPCANSLQGARWIESSDYAHFPILPWSSIDVLQAYYLENHGVEIDLENWESALIMMGIPLARRRLVVIAEESFRLPEFVGFEARARSIDLQVFPLSFFPPEHLDQMRRQWLVQSEDLNGLEYSEELQAGLGQSPQAHEELLPEWIRAQKIPVSARGSRSGS